MTNSQPTNSPSAATPAPPLAERLGSEVTDAVRAQILATEHWSLIATRSMTWNEVFSRASMFITVHSAAVVALALVAQATAFGPGSRLFAVLVLPVALVVGAAGETPGCRNAVGGAEGAAHAAERPHRMLAAAVAHAERWCLVTSGRLCGAVAKVQRAGD